MISEVTRKIIGKVWQGDPNERMKYAQILSDLYEGNVLYHVEQRINKEFKSEKQRNEIKARTLDLQLVSRIVKKLSKAYNDKPTRTLVGGNSTDLDMFGWYLNTIDFNVLGQKIDKNFNNYKEFNAKFYFNEKTGLPAVKLIDPFRYIALSTDRQNEASVDIIAEFWGLDKDKQEILLCQTDDEIWFQNVNGELIQSEMAYIGNPDGINIYNKLSYIYGCNSSNSVMPYPDKSMVNVGTLFPVLLGDINYAIKYMSYAMIWGRNVKEQLIERAPNSFLNLLPQDDSSQVVPEIGAIKPEIDIKEVLDGIMIQLGLWLSSRGINSSLIATASGSFSSGISKMIDEADVSGIITTNQEIYREAEKRMFDFIMYHGHEIWKNQNPEIPSASFTPGCYVETTFPKSEPIKTRAEIIAEVKEELAANITSKKRAIKRVNPTMSDNEIMELILEIEGEKQKPQSENKEQGEV
jgi:hypothetical protein